jgi:GNAT superfamily N-acetyltransferase
MPVHADLSLARRLEEAESAMSAEFARLHEPEAAEVVPVAGGRAVFAGVGGHMTEAKAMGLHGPVQDEDLDRLEALYFSNGSAAKVWVCPLADGSLTEKLASRGYRPVEFEAILFRPLDDLSGLPIPAPGIAVRPCEAAEGERYAAVVGPAFTHPEPPAPDLLRLVAAGFRAVGAHPFLAWMDGQAVGGGMMIERGGLAFLAGAATRPEFRRRGVQTALSHARLHLARQRGCDVAIQGAQPGSASQRTAERLGFRVAYTRLALQRDPS